MTTTATCLSGAIAVAAAPTTAATLPTVELFSVSNTPAGQPARFRVTRSGPVDQPLNVKLRTLEGGTAVEGSDYLLPQHVTLTAGQSEAIVEIATAKADKPPFTHTLAVAISPDPLYVAGRFDCDGLVIEWGRPEFRGVPEGMSSNMDDDNENGIEDRYEMGQVQGEDDLYPVELVIPPVPIDGTVIKLTIKTGNLRIWETSDKSGRCLATSGQPECRWIVGKTIAIPRTVWVEKVSIVAPGGASLELAVDEPQGKLWKHFPERLAILYPDAARATTGPATAPTTGPAPK